MKSNSAAVLSLTLLAGLLTAAATFGSPLSLLRR